MTCLNTLKRLLHIALNPFVLLNPLWRWVGNFADAMEESEDSIEE